MSTSQLQQIISHYRQLLKDGEAQAEHTLNAAYAHTLASIQPQLDHLYQQMQAKQEAGEDIPLSWLYEQRRLQNLTQLINNQMNHYGNYAQTVVEQEQHRGVALGSKSAQDLLDATVPPGVDWNFGIPSTKAIANLIGATQAGSPLADLFNSFGAEAAKLVKDALTTGITLGNNPREVARDVQQALNVPRNRALTISRTEMLRSYREANLETYQANSDVCAKWRWTADKSMRTCAACIAMDGTLHDLTEEMASHVNCRCAPLPVTKSWDDILGPLGIDTSTIPETSIAIQSGSEWFNAQDEATQRAILGNAKYEAFQAGKFDLEDIVGHSHDEDWGHSIFERSLDETIKAAESKPEEVKLPDERASMGVPSPSSAYQKAYDKAEQAYLQRFAKDHGLSVEEYVKAANEHVAKMVGDASLWTRHSTDSLMNILEDGRFKSQFESGRGTLVNTKLRSDFEAKVQGVPSDIDPTRRPIYGYLSAEADGQLGNEENFLDRYGDVAIRLKEGVRDFTTFAWQDSFTGTQNGKKALLVPQSLSEPSMRSFLVGNDPFWFQSVDDNLSREHNYTEIQVHNGLRASDIAEVVFSSPPDWQMITLLKRLHIPYRVYREE